MWYDCKAGRKIKRNERKKKHTHTHTHQNSLLLCIRYFLCKCILCVVFRLLLFILFGRGAGSFCIFPIINVMNVGNYYRFRWSDSLNPKMTLTVFYLLHSYRANAQKYPNDLANNIHYHFTSSTKNVVPVQ